LFAQRRSPEPAVVVPVHAGEEQLLATHPAQERFRHRELARRLRIVERLERAQTAVTGLDRRGAPELAELGERIATAGPPVCVAMVVTTETITREAFGGRERLIVALAEHNAQLFSEQALAQLRVYRSRA
jgi:hypothetical protein